MVPLRATAAGLLTALSGCVEPGAWPRLEQLQRWQVPVAPGAQRLRLAACRASALLLEAGGSSYLEGGGGPRDGTLLVLCQAEGRRLRVLRQLVANNGEGFELRQLFGLQETDSQCLLVAVCSPFEALKRALKGRARRDLLDAAEDHGAAALPPLLLLPRLRRGASAARHPLPAVPRRGQRPAAAGHGASGAFGAPAGSSASRLGANPTTV